MEIINLKPYLVAHCAAIAAEIDKIDRYIKNNTLSPSQLQSVNIRRQTWVEMAQSATDILKLATEQYRQLQHNKLIKVLEATRLNLEGYENWKAQRTKKHLNN